ncbi:MAG: leucine-rich repeat domain-containing protein [Loktanella sp.]|nr:leucine-rich repeat domain-containing protein [Loktanella sp.]
MDVHDISGIEFDPEALKRVRTQFERKVQDGENFSQTLSELFADAILQEHQLILKDNLVRVVLIWAKKHKIAQFSEFISMMSDEYLTQRRVLPNHVLDKIYALETVSAARSFMEEPVIKYIPDAVFQLPNLKTLVMGRGGYEELYNVKLEMIPPAITEAKNLASLHLQHCGLTELPAYLFTPSLRQLKIGANDIKIIPDAIGKAVNLEMLTAWGNDLEYISSEIGSLKKLKRIDIWGSNRLILPESIVNLGDMEYVFIADAKGLTPAQVTWLRKNGMPEEAIFPKLRSYAEQPDNNLSDDDLPF